MEIAFIAGFVFLLVLEPLAVIWALNTLFHLGIALTFWNWLAVLTLNFVIVGPSRMKSK